MEIKCEQHPLRIKETTKGLVLSRIDTGEVLFEYDCTTGSSVNSYIPYATEIAWWDVAERLYRDRFERLESAANAFAKAADKHRKDIPVNFGEVTYSFQIESEFACACDVWAFNSNLGSKRLLASCPFFNFYITDIGIPLGGDSVVEMLNDELYDMIADYADGCNLKNKEGKSIGQILEVFLQHIGKEFEEYVACIREFEKLINDLGKGKLGFVFSELPEYEEGMQATPREIGEWIAEQIHIFLNENHAIDIC